MQVAIATWPRARYERRNAARRRGAGSWWGPGSAPVAHPRGSSSYARPHFAQPRIAVVVTSSPTSRAGQASLVPSHGLSHSRPRSGRQIGSDKPVEPQARARRENRYGVVRLVEGSNPSLSALQVSGAHPSYAPLAGAGQRSDLNAARTSPRTARAPPRQRSGRPCRPRGSR